MTEAAKTQITVAVIGLIGVLGAALITNWPHIAGNKQSTKASAGEPNTITVEYTLTCKFTFGPRAGTTFRFAPGPGITPAPIGALCTDGAGSSGVAVKE